MSQPSAWERYWRAIEHVIEQVVFASRWLLAPFYVGLCLSIIVLLIKFLAELLHLFHEAFSMSESDVIVGVLSLVDMALAGSLLIIVIFSGYENFVSRMNHSDHKDWPQWMGTIDFSALKLKLLSSIVAISAIQLLKQFMSIKTVSPEAERTLFWMVIIHVVFVISSVLLALSDRISGHGNGHDGSTPHAEPHDASHGKSHDAPLTAPKGVPSGEIQIASALVSSEASAPGSQAAHQPGKPGRDGKKSHK